MQGKNARKFRRRGGFTFAEVLVTLAILGVLLAVAIPATISMARSLKMMELDSCARQIAVAVQNNLTGMKSAGTLKSFGDKNSGSIGGYCISNGHAEVQKILPLGAIDPAVAGKYYTIVYNSATGTVLEVYYAEDPFTVSDALSGMETVKVEARKAAKIGYYNGADIDSAPIGTLPKPMLIVENGLDLKVTVTTPIMPIDWRDKAALTLHVAKEIGTGEVEFVMSSTQVATQILDSLEDNFQYRFDHIVNGDAFKKKIAPGENLKIWATLDPIEPKKYLSATSNIEYANSLFGAYDLAKNEVTIKNSRHLQNLDKLYSGVNLPNTLRATQTENIDWHRGLTFVPINNDLLTSYNGGTKLIRGLNVTANTSAGLFERFSGQTLTGIRLVNPSIVSTDNQGVGGLTAGALVGTAENVEITDCFAYAEKVNGNWPVAQISGITAGGLIGSATNCSISYSGAAMPVVTGTTVAAGGLIGVAKGETEIELCYAATDSLQVTQEDAYVAGFIGSADGVDVEVENCYAVGNIAHKVNKPSGFISGNRKQNVVTVSVEDSYCAMTYLDAAGKPLGLEDIDGFSHVHGDYINCYYLIPVGATVSTYSEGSEISYAELAKTPVTIVGDWIKYPMSYPYRDNLQGKTYPFPAIEQEDGLAMPHHGSWPAVPAPKGEVLLAYYEEYTDGTTGIYYLDKGGKVQNTLDHKNEKTITSTQYGILFEGVSDTGVFDVQMNGDPLGYGTPIDVKAEGTQCQFYPFSAETLGAIPADAATVVVGSGEKGRTYQMYPRFAAGIAQEGIILGNEALPLQVRTQPQLEAVVPYNNQDNSYFGQTHNISISGEWTPMKMPTKRTYDGGNNNITELTKPLFEAVQSGSTVKNVVIEQAQIAGIQGDGIFAKVNSGTITSCSVRNSDITFYGWQSQSVAGFVGTNSGTITLCSAVADVTSTNGTAAGFVGTNKGTIQTSYANCMVQGGTDASGFVNVNENGILSCYAMGSATAKYGTATGFAIQSRWAPANIKGCYAAVIVSGSRVNSFGTSYVGGWSACYYYPPDGTSAGDAKASNDASGATRVTSYANATGNSLLNNLIRASGSDIWTGAGPAHPFNPALGETIPFPSISGNEHYGDWPTRSLSDGNFMGVFYYKDNGDGTYFIDAAGIEVEFVDGTYGKISKVQGEPIAHAVNGNFSLSVNSGHEYGFGMFCPSTFVANTRAYCNFILINGEEKRDKMLSNQPWNAKINDIYTGYDFFAYVDAPSKWESKTTIITLSNTYKSHNFQYNFRYNTTTNEWTFPNN